MMPAEGVPAAVTMLADALPELPGLGKQVVARHLFEVFVHRISPFQAEKRSKVTSGSAAGKRGTLPTDHMQPFPWKARSPGAPETAARPRKLNPWTFPAGCIITAPLKGSSRGAFVRSCSVVSTDDRFGRRQIGLPGTAVRAKVAAGKTGMGIDHYPRFTPTDPAGLSQ